MNVEGNVMIFRCDEFIENNINPITNKNYDDSWIVFILNNEPYNMLCGSQNGCAYTLKVSKQYKQWEMALGDFVGYNSSIGKNIILVVSEQDYAHALKVYEGYSFDDHFLREYENDVLIHSTTKENYEHIKEDGCLKSWNLLRSQNICMENEPIGRALGDPIELRDYILFGSGTTGEIVVNSKQKKRIEMDENTDYIAGARLYFDMKKIAEDGLLVRDGGEIKVKNKLSLHPYLLFVATWDSVGLDCEVTTPRIFAQRADKYFKENILKTYKYEHLYLQ